jgi:preprotein translocase SecE subunit
MRLQFNNEKPRKGFFKPSLSKNTMSILSYFRETKGELAHVNWPTKRQSIIFSVVVIAISVLTAFFLGLFDFIFSRILNFFI